MKLIRLIPLGLCTAFGIIVVLNVNTGEKSFLGMMSLWLLGYAISSYITTTFPEDECSPYFQIHLNKVIITIISIIAIIVCIIFFNTEEYDCCIISMWMYLSIITGYIYGEFGKA